MGRLFLIVMMLAVCAVIAMILHALWTQFIATAGAKGRPLMAQGRNGDMAPSGIQKVAYVALIVVLFGVASGWLGGL